MSWKPNREIILLLPVDVTQIASFDEIPMKQADDIEKLIGGSNDLIASVDPLSTGSIAHAAPRSSVAANIVIPGVRP